jgi:hypothetical protein
MYAIRAGRVCGVFTDLEETKNSIVNFRGAEFAEFKELFHIDAYLSRYVSMYPEYMLPVIPDTTVMIHIFVQPVENENGTTTYVCGSACFNNTFIAASTKVQPATMEYVSVLELCNSIPDNDEKDVTVKVGVYIAEPIQFSDTQKQIHYPKTPEDGCKNTILTAMEKPDEVDSENKQYISSIIQKNAKRKRPLIFQDATDISSLYATRSAIHSAAILVWRQLQEMHNV